MKKYAILFLILTISFLVKQFSVDHPSGNLFALSFTDITKMAGLIEKKPVPVPYVNSYVEYPVVIGIFIWLVGTLSSSRESYFFLSGLILSVLTMLCLFLSEKIDSGGKRSKSLALFWLLPPSVFLFAVYNWDILAVFFLLLSLFFYYRDKTIAGTVFLSLGTWSKLFPVFLLPAVVFREALRRRFRNIGLILSVFVVVSLALNLPFALKSFTGWSAFFAFSKARGPNLDSVWAGLYVISDKLLGNRFNLKGYYTVFINYFSNFSLLALLSLFYWKAWKRKYDNLIVLTLAGVLVFLVTAKVYSPPYNLWVLPLSALAVIGLGSFLFYDVVNALVFFVVFQYFYEANILGRQILGFPWYKLTYLLVVVRQVILIWLTYKVWRLIKKVDEQ